MNASTSSLWFRSSITTVSCYSVISNWTTLWQYSAFRVRIDTHFIEQHGIRNKRAPRSSQRDPHIHCNSMRQSDAGEPIENLPCMLQRLFVRAIFEHGADATPSDWSMGAKYGALSAFRPFSTGLVLPNHWKASKRYNQVRCPYRFIFVHQSGRIEAARLHNSVGVNAVQTPGIAWTNVAYDNLGRIWLRDFAAFYTALVSTTDIPQPKRRDNAKTGTPIFRGSFDIF